MTTKKGGKIEEKSTSRNNKKHFDPYEELLKKYNKKDNDHYKEYIKPIEDYQKIKGNSRNNIGYF